MGNDGRKARQAMGIRTTEIRRELEELTRRAEGTNEQQALVALERYLQIPTFRRQGKRLSCH
ncbi:MAG: hypothetical protein ACOY8P_12240 [Thermodesulfobacteriota bacterium]